RLVSRHHRGPVRMMPRTTVARTTVARTAIALAVATAAAILPGAPGAAGNVGASTSESRPTLVDYTIVDDAIPKSLTGAPGDPARGRAIIVKRENICLLCHSGPFPEQRFQGDLAPPLDGTGSRWSAGELRLRLVDATRLNPDTIMPSFYRVDGFNRVATAFRGKPVLTAAQIEDVVAYLATLKDEP